MARLNIEQCWWSDPRRERLADKVGGLELADAAAIRLWRLAQEFWQNGQLVPEQIFSTLKHSDVFLACQLAEARDGGIYVRGSSQYLSWTIEAKEQRKKGGRNSAQARLEKYGTARPQIQTGFELTPNSTRTGSNSLEVSGFSSGSEKKEITLRVQETADAVPAPIPKREKFNEHTRKKMQSFLAEYASGWKTKYGGNPESLRDKGLVGKLGHWIETVSEDRALSLIQVYLQIDYRPFNESYHDLWQFFRHLNRIGVALDTGKTTGQVDWSYVFGSAL